MLMKLLKYECKASMRIFGVVYLAILGLCVGSGILNRITEYEKLSYFNEPISQVGVVVYIITFLFLLAAVVITTVINLRRFYQGVFRDEGYLMHTLPVQPWEILTSKLLAAVLWTIATGLVMLVGVGIAVTIGYIDSIVDFIQGVAEFFTDLFSDPMYLLLALVELVCTILRVYAAIALGQIFSRRVMAAVLAWFGLNTIQTWAGMLLGANVFETLVDSMFIFFEPDTSLSAYALLIGVTLFWSAAYWVVTQWVMTKKLNLE